MLNPRSVCHQDASPALSLKRILKRKRKLQPQPALCLTHPTLVRDIDHATKKVPHDNKNEHTWLSWAAQGPGSGPLRQEKGHPHSLIHGHARHFALLWCKHPIQVRATLLGGASLNGGTSLKLFNHALGALLPVLFEHKILRYAEIALVHPEHDREILRLPLLHVRVAVFES